MIFFLTSHPGGPKGGGGDPRGLSGGLGATGGILQGGEVRENMCLASQDKLLKMDGNGETTIFYVKIWFII